MIERKILTAAHPALKPDAGPVVVKEDGLFTGWASTYSNVDLGNDVVCPGAYKHIADGTEFPLLNHHKQDEPLGLFRVSKESSGLRVQGQLNLEVQRAREVRALMKQGALTGLSIGYQVKDSYKEAGVRYLTKLDLLEVSIVTFPMNPKARVTGLKAAEQEAEYRQALEAIRQLNGEIRDYFRRRAA